MTAVELLSRARALGIRLWVDGGRLRYDAPAGALSEDLRRHFAEHRDEIIGMLGTVPGESPPPLASTDRTGLIPLSFAQQRLWLLEQLEPGTSVYHTYGAVRIVGALDVAVLARSLSEVVRRHEALRTTFVVVGGVPHQRIGPAEPLSIEIEDLGHLPPDERAREAQARADFHRRTTFDLTAGPLIRVHLLRLDDLEHVLVVVMHHIVCDGWSVAVLTGELTVLYEAFAAGRPSPLQELSIQYGDFAVWQRAALQGDRLASQLKFWQRQLDGVAALELPTRPRPLTPSGRGAEESLSLSARQEAALESLSRREGVTLFMTLLAAFDVLLARYARQGDIVVGVPVANRTQPQLEPLIGFFVNMLVMRSDLSGNPSFRELLARVRTMALDAYAHQDTPFERIVEELQPDRESGRTPFFQVAFGFQNTPAASLHLGAARLEPMRIANPTSRFDLELNVSKQEGGLLARLNYSTDLFDAADVQAMLRAFGVLLDAVVADPDARISRLPMMAASDRRTLAEKAGDGRALPPVTGTVASRFEEQAVRTPGATAVVFNDDTLTYASLNERANQLARHLQAAGVRPGALVGVALDRSLDLIVSLVAILKTGAAYVPLDPAYPAARLSFVIDDAALRVVVTVSSLREGMPEAPGVRILCLDLEAGAIAALPDGNQPLAIGPNDVAYVTYTSGSTGIPKGVEVPHRGVLRLLADQTYATFDANQRILQLAPVAFDASTFDIWGALLYGGQCVLFPDRLPVMELVEATMVRHRITSIFLTTSLFNEVVDKIPGALRSLRTVITGGEVVSVAHVRKALAALPDTTIVHAYGPTECTTFTTCGAIERDLPEGIPTLPIGYPLARTQIYFLDDEFNPVPDGMVGELCVGGEGVAIGYLRRPELTAEKFIPDAFSGIPGARLYRTGDLGRRLADGQIDFQGRSDRQIKIRGFRVELGEIETAVLEDPGVHECVVELRRDTGDKQLVAYIVPDPANPVVPDVLTAQLRTRLPSYMVPAAIVLLERLPLNANGKVDRRLLPAPQQAVPQEREMVAPRTALEATIAAIWREVLGLDRVGVRDNFFDLGGHSLLLIRVHGRLIEVLKRSVQVVDLFRHPTIESLARELGGETVETRPLEQARARIARRGASGEPNEAIAVIGMAGRFPGAANVDAFWANLRQGVESIRVFSDDELAAAGVSEALIADPRYVRARGVLDGVEMFDAGFFGYTPREAEVMDPQHRVFLECAWEALERSGYDPARYDGLIGVFAGANLNSYAANLLSNREALAAIGGVQSLISIAGDFLPTRVSYKLNLRGPSVNIQTACSTSLVAVQLACRSLSAHDCDMALAGGVSITVPYIRGHMFQEGGIASPDGHTRAFDRASQGTVPGNGVGIVVLKRLADALADGDDIQAVIRGAAINNDGSTKVGFTAPGVDGQAEVVAMAQASAGVEPSSITYIEAHGTGTALGDPIEINALTRVFGQGEPNSCAIGTLKTNVGHLDSAAGVSGLIKTVLALKHRELPPSLHFEEPNPKIDFASGPFYVNARLQPWTSAGGPRRAGVSSFGIGGTNAHVVLEEAPPLSPTTAGREAHVLLLSGRTAEALAASALRLADFLETHAEAPLADVAYTLAIGRQQFAQHRRAVACTSHAEAIRALRSEPASSTPAPEHSPGELSCVFMFTGQGAQFVNMFRGLYRDDASFRADVDACCGQVAPYVDGDLKTALFPATDDDPLAVERLEQTRFTQPALFVVEYALARLWMRWGVQPSAMLGHSIGEYVAACLAGVFSLDDALRMVATRGRLMQEQAPGAMLAVPLAEADVVAMLTPSLSLAAVNSPALTVVSGPLDDIAEFEAGLASRGVACRRLKTSHAFHSAMMEPALKAFQAALGAVKLSAPQTPFVSNVTGTWITDAEATAPSYWARHLREPVRFADGVATVLQQPGCVLIEVGPGEVLASLARQQRRPAGSLIVASCPRREAQSDVAGLLTALGRLWVAGVTIDWKAFYAGERRRRVSLPTYPFERARYWIEARPAPAPPASRAPLDQWLLVPAWSPAAPVRKLTIAPPATRQRWLLFADQLGLATRAATLLTKLGHAAVMVSAGETFAATAAGRITIRPSRPEDYKALLDQLAVDGQLPDVIGHFWGVSRELPDESESTAQVLDDGFYSLLWLQQAFGTRASGAARRLGVVTTHRLAVAVTEPVSPARATVSGPLLVIPAEDPHVTCRGIDVVASEWLAADDEQLLELLAEISEGTDPTVAYRAGKRWLPGSQPAPSATPVSKLAARPRLRDEGVYLITGAFGGIGSTLARYLAEHHKARLVLIGRRPLPDRDVQQLEALGAEVAVVAASVTDEAAMRAAVDEARRRWGAVHGVIHAAGIAGGGVVQLKTRDAVERVFAPKVLGTQVLARVLEDGELDFFLLCSSLAAVTGGAGQVDYCAANAYLDAFAHHHARLTGTFTVSVNWDIWSDAGMAVETALPGDLARRRDVALRRGMSNDEGVEVFVRVVSGVALPQVLVSTMGGEAKPARANRELAGGRAPAETSHAPARYDRPPIATRYAAPGDSLERTIAGVWQDLLGIAEIGRHDNFFDLGGHSLLLVQAHGTLTRTIGRNFPVTDLFEYPTISALAEHLGGGSHDDPALTAVVRPSHDSAVAVVGMAGRFPGAGDLDRFWSNLRAGDEAIRFCTDDELRRQGVDEQLLAQPNYVKAVSAIDDVDLFDASFFGYTPREAELLDPQHRVFLECAWEALEHAGCDPARHRGLIGVFAGASSNGYLGNVASNAEVLRSSGAFQAAMGSKSDFLPSRVSYKLNLKGPSVNVQTACSTSLVAVHQACRSLLDGECDAALAGGVSIGVPTAAGYLYYDEGILSPDGHCRPFDADARGTVPASGAGVVVLKRLADALADGDCIYAVVRGSAINNDGATKVGYTAPSVAGQAAVIARAQAVAGVRPSEVSYIEAHGTATALGDPIEIAALNKVFGDGPAPPCAIGTVKSNLGHLDAAAGVAGLIKTVLALHHRELPPSLHFRTANPQIDFASARFRVNTELQAWPAGDRPRLAGVSSFGIGGTNAHVLVEEAPPTPPSGPSRPWQLLVLSAKSPSALDAASVQLFDRLKTFALPLADVAFTLQEGRASFAHRQVILCRDGATGAGWPGVSGLSIMRGSVDGAEPACVFMLSDLGSHHPALARALDRSEPGFRAGIDLCAAIVRRLGAGDLRARIVSDQVLAADAPPEQVALAAAAAFAVDYALATLLMQWGVEPAALVGHGLSEYVAACLAGVFQPEGALALVVAAAKMQCVPAEGSSASALTAVALQNFRTAVASVPRLAPKRRVASTVTGTWLTAEEATSVEYWIQHLQRPARFAECVRTLATLPAPLFLEVGPGRLLAALVAQSPDARGSEPLPTLPEAQDETAAGMYLLETLGRLWTRGVTVDWHAFTEGERRLRVALPTYPFQRQRYWIEKGASAPSPGVRHSLAKNADADAWFYVPTWMRSVRPPAIPKAVDGGSWLLFEDEAGLGAALSRLLERDGCRPVTVRAGERFAVMPDGAYTVNPRVAADYDLLLDHLAASSAVPRRIAHMWSIGAAAASNERDRFDRAQSAGFYSVLYLTQSLVRHGVDDADVTVIGDDWSAIIRGDTPRPETAPVLALCAVITQEHPGLRTSTIEAGGFTPANGAALAEQVWQELSAGSDGTAVAYRGPQRWVQTYEPATLGAGWDAVVRERGVYVITGGLGNVGLALAERLAETKGARLVLVGRTALPDRTQWDAWLAAHDARDPVSRQLSAVRRLEMLGSEVMLCAADVADAERFVSVVVAARDRFGAVHGIFHAAGTTSGDGLGPIATLERDACEAQFRPKVDGLYAVERAAAAVTPDFCALTSSLSAILGGLGFGAYAAANRFMDAFAEARANESVRWISVDFDGWNFAPAGAGKSAVTELAMTPTEGVRSLERIIGSPALSRVAVSTGNLDARLDRYVRRTRAAGPPAAEALTQHARPETANAYVAPGEGMERLMASLWQELIGIDRVGRLDDFFDLGGHSLLATRVIAHIKERCGVELPLKAFFETPRLAELAERVSALQWAGQGRREAVPGAADREEIEI